MMNETHSKYLHMTQKKMVLLPRLFEAKNTILKKYEEQFKTMNERKEFLVISETAREQLLKSQFQKYDQELQELRGVLDNNYKTFDSRLNANEKENQRKFQKLALK